MKVYTIWNMKGGVSKTTLAVNMAAFMAEMGNKTLLIDADVQCNSTMNYKGKYEGVATLYDVIVDKDSLDINEAIQRTDVGDLIAGDPLLIEAEPKYTVEIEGIYRLKDALDNLKGYDVVIIDTNPAANRLLQACLIASDSVIIPTTPEMFSIQGLEKVRQYINSVKKRNNPGLQIEGILISRVDGNSNILKVGIDTIREYGKENDIRVFDTVIKQCVKVRESQTLSTSLAKYAPYCTTALNYKNFLKEMLK